MKKLPRREFLRVAGLAAASSILSHPALAQAYPARPVRLVVPFNAGGSTDIVGRIMCQWLTERLGQSFVVENKPGGGTNIATQMVVNSPADGYTLLYTVSTHAINPSLYKSLPFNFQRDIVAVGGLFEFPLVLVMNPQVPANNLAEFIAYAKANPGKVNMASFGVKTISHLSIELLKTLDRHRLRPRPLHRRRADGDRHHCRPGPGRCRCAAEFAAAHQERLDARACHPVACADAALAGRADRGRAHPGLRGHRMERCRRAEGHAARDRRAPQPRDQRGPARCGAAQACRRYRRRADPCDAHPDGRDRSPRTPTSGPRW